MSLLSVPDDTPTRGESKAKTNVTLCGVTKTENRVLLIAASILAAEDWQTGSPQAFAATNCGDLRCRTDR